MSYLVRGLMIKKNLTFITVTLGVAFLSIFITLLCMNRVQLVPVQRDFENMFGQKLNEKVSEQPIGINESNNGYSNNTLFDLESNFYFQEGITHDVLVKNVHSHNDYWRSRPLLHALSYGAKSVEADVWYFEELSDPTIYVGHSLDSLNMNRTLDSLYLNPLMAILKGSNPLSGFKSKIRDISLDGLDEAIKDPSGVWFTDSYATLYFLIDFKTDGDVLFDVIHRAFNDLRQNKWLSQYNTKSGEFLWGPITVIGTGNTPLDKVLNQGEIRDIFFDGPLDLLDNMQTKYHIGVSPMVSCSLKKLIGAESVPISGLTDKQNEKMKQQIQLAHQLGVITRIWDTPWWPVHTQDKVWKQIIDAGSDLLNADDLEKATNFS